MKFLNAVTIVSIIIAFAYLIYIFCFGFDANYVDVGWFRVAILWILSMAMIFFNE